MNDADKARALELRLAGVSYAKIAETLGLEDAIEAHAAILDALSSDKGESHDDAILLEVMRLDRLHTALWPRAVKGDLGALDRIMRLSERRLALTERLNPKVPPPHCWTGLYRNRGNGTVSTAPGR